MANEAGMNDDAGPKRLAFQDFALGDGARAGAPGGAELHECKL
jgi:hypothetical protein